MTEPTSIIGPAILEIDQAIAKTQISQKELGKELDRLVESEYTLASLVTHFFFFFYKSFLSFLV